MKKFLLMSLMLMLSLGYASAQKEAEIKFEKPHTISAHSQRAHQYRNALSHSQT